MGDKTGKTIDFLRARLLHERSVSRTARQRAYELAKRVTELEKQLKFVSLQRKKAEKATADVLTILENHGRNDLSEPFDSSSDKEEVSSDYKDGKYVEASEHAKVQESDMEGFSCSEVESSSVNGRSLSWKSSKNSSSRYTEKKYVDASRRRRSFTSAGSSSRRVGRSCRQIRQREHRSAADGSQNGHLEDEGRRGSDLAIETSLGHGIHKKDKDELEVAATSSCNRHDIQNHETEREMERALEHQAQFIAQYEAEEKAQKEWEDKFRENNGSPPDSGDPGTHSDITDESKVQGPIPEKLASETQEIDSGVVNEEPKIDTEVDHKNDNEESGDQNRQPDLQPTNLSPAEVIVIPTLGTQEVSNELGSVLEALQQAKLSLRQNLDKSPLLETGPSYGSGDKFAVPFSSAGLFRLPTDYEYLVTTRTNALTYDPRLSLSNYGGGERGSISRSSCFVEERFRQGANPEIPRQPPSTSRVDMQQSPLDPRVGIGSGTSALDSQFQSPGRYGSLPATRYDGYSQPKYL